MKTDQIKVALKVNETSERRFKKLIKLLNSSLDIILSEHNYNLIDEVSYFSDFYNSDIIFQVSYEKPLSLQHVVSESERIIKHGQQFIEPSFKLDNKKYDVVGIADMGIYNGRWSLREANKYGEDFSTFLQKGEPLMSAVIHKYYENPEDIKEALGFADWVKYIQPPKLFDNNGNPVLMRSPTIKLLKSLNTFDEKTISDILNKSDEVNDSFYLCNKNTTFLHFYEGNFSLLYPINVSNSYKLVAERQVSLSKKPKEFIFDLS